MVVVGAGVAAASDLRALSLAEQQQDLDQLRAALDEWHPGLGTVADEAEVTAAFERARAELRDGDSVLGFLRAAMLPVAAMRCGHTVVEPAGDLERALYAEGGWFPVDLWPDGDRLWLDPRVVPGPPRELLAVGDTPAAELVRELRARIESDGGAPAGQDLWIDREPWFATTVILGRRDEWTLTTRVRGGAPVVETFPGADPDLVRTGRSTLRPSGVVAPGVVYLRLSELAGSARESRRFVRDVGAIAARQEAVILDLRGNGGGRTASLMDLLALFVDHPFDPYRSGLARVPWREWPLGDDGLHHAGPRTPGLYGGVQPLGATPTARLVVLVDGQTGSSASDLAYLLRREAGATIVGTETAGGAWAQTAERTVHRVLVHSGLVVQIPLVTIVMGPDDLEGRGVIPDHEVRPTAEELATGQDPAFACAIAVARGFACPVRAESAD